MYFSMSYFGTQREILINNIYVITEVIQRGSKAFLERAGLGGRYIEENQFDQNVKPVGIHRTMEVSDTEFLV